MDIMKYEGKYFSINRDEPDLRSDVMIQRLLKELGLDKLFLIGVRDDINDTYSIKSASEKHKSWISVCIYSSNYKPVIKELVEVYTYADIKGYL